MVLETEQDRPAQTRMTVLYRCESIGRSDGIRVLKPPCGRWITLTTTKREGTREKPWFGICPFCSKKSRMRHRELIWYQDKNEAKAEAYRRNLRQEQEEE